MLDQTWHKSTRSGSNGQCVEARRMAGTVQLRDSKDRSGPVLSFPLGAWAAFTDGLKGAEFDH